MPKPGPTEEQVYEAVAYANERLASENLAAGQGEGR